ncbi:hypothetical protein MTO96_016171 [Rhipicephalus appendiculatus]
MLRGFFGDSASYANAFSHRKAHYQDPASETSEAEQEEDDKIFIESDASSHELPEALPTRVESPEGSWSWSSGETILEEGDVVLTELTSVPSAQLTEPIAMPREPSLRPVTVAVDVEGRVEQLLLGYAIGPSKEGCLLPKPEDNLQAPGHTGNSGET